ncbi:MAG: hypothetical protein ABI629_05245 [bacterium]
MLVRPDGHVAWRSLTAPSQPTSALRAACAYATGQRRTVA